MHTLPEGSFSTLSAELPRTQMRQGRGRSLSLMAGYCPIPVLQELLI